MYFVGSYYIRYIYWRLRAGRSGIESRRAPNFPPVQTGPGAHPASCKMGTVSFPGAKCGRGVLLTTHPLLVPQSWKSRATPLPTLWATPDLQRDHFSFFNIYWRLDRCYFPKHLKLTTNQQCVTSKNIEGLKRRSVPVMFSTSPFCKRRHVYTSFSIQFRPVVQFPKLIHYILRRVFHTRIQFHGRNVPRLLPYFTLFHVSIVRHIPKSSVYPSALRLQPHCCLHTHSRLPISPTSFSSVIFLSFITNSIFDSGFIAFNL